MTKKINPDHYKYKVIKIFKSSEGHSRKDATNLECTLHKKFNVKESNVFINRGNQTSSKFSYGKHTEASKRKMSKSHSGKKKSDETKKVMSEVKSGSDNPMFGYKFDKEQKKKLSALKKGKQQTQTVCPQCGKLGGLSLMKRYHFENCKTNTSS